MHPKLQSFSVSGFVFRALDTNGTLDNAIAPKIGRVAFAAFLKNERRDCNSSFLFSFMLVQSCPIGLPESDC